MSGLNLFTHLCAPLIIFMCVSCRDGFKGTVVRTDSVWWLLHVVPYSISGAGCPGSQDEPVYRCLVYTEWDCDPDPVRQAGHTADSHAAEHTYMVLKYSKMAGNLTFGWFRLHKHRKHDLLSDISVWWCCVPCLRGKSLHSPQWVSLLYCRPLPRASHDPHWSENKHNTMSGLF